jgi:hypothetical protein
MKSLQLRCCYPEFGVNGSDRGDVWAAIGRTAGKPGKCGFRSCVLSGPQGPHCPIPCLNSSLRFGWDSGSPLLAGSFMARGGTGTRLPLAGEEEVRLSRERDTCSGVVAVMGPPGGLASQIVPERQPDLVLRRLALRLEPHRLVCDAAQAPGQRRADEQPPATTHDGSGSRASEMDSTHSLVVPHPAPSGSGLGAGGMLVATTKQDCRDSSSPRARPLIAVIRLLLDAHSVISR